MPATVPVATTSTPRKGFELRPSMAKAELNILEHPWRALIGRAIARAFALAGWLQKEAADKVGRDQAQIARWVAGTERPQFDALFAVPELRSPLVLALAELSDDIEIATEIRLRRVG